MQVMHCVIYLVLTLVNAFIFFRERKMHGLFIDLTL